MISLVGEALLSVRIEPNMGIDYYLLLYVSVFGFILFVIYLIPAGLAYFIFYVLKKDDWKYKHIQDRFPQKESILREIKWSLITVAITAFLTSILYLFVQKGWTKMYFVVQAHGWVYLFFSTVLIIILYDGYFYWVHRFMHLKKVFPWVHRTHHLSNTPTPWAVLAFAPLEAVLEFGIYPLMIFAIPLHPVAIGVFVLFNVVHNTAGHIGYEILPRSALHHWFFRLGLTVTHHEMHHSKVKYNYGIYFNIWDRIMHTNHPDYEKTFLKVKDKLPST